MLAEPEMKQISETIFHGISMCFGWETLKAA
jgi:hypothetical protein